MRVQRHTTGSVRYDKRRGTWQYAWYEAGQRKTKLIGSKRDFPNKASAWKQVERLGLGKPKQTGDTMQVLIERYKKERMPSRHSTACTYNSFLKNYVSPQWGKTMIQDIQPRSVELWLKSLDLSGKSRTHIRSLMHLILEFAMFSGALPAGRNPISLVRNAGATKRVRKAAVLTVEQFQLLLKELREPFATLASTAACLGLRISETLALRWSDVDFLRSRISINRGIVQQRVDDCKTQGSAKTFTLSDELRSRLMSWRQATEFRADSDWIFASPVKLGRLPYSYTGVRQELERAAEVAEIGHISTHSFRHSFRSWLSSLGTQLDVTKQLMRHSTITMTMDGYGALLGNDAATATEQIARLALNGTPAGCKDS